jgi:non-ribosomal peptide synthetase component F
MSFADILEQHADTRPSHSAIEDGDQVICYGELASLVHEKAVSLHAAGVQRGDTVTLILPDNADYQDILDGFDHVVQFQIVRRAEEKLEMKLVVRRALAGDEEQQLTTWLQERFQYPFAVAFTYHDEIPRTPSGKFFDYFSEVD